MNKKLTYGLFLTTILSHSIVVANDDTPLTPPAVAAVKASARAAVTPGTPLTPGTADLQQQIEAEQRTPEIKRVAAKEYSPSVYSPRAHQFLIGLREFGLFRERDQRIALLRAQIEDKKAERRTVRQIDEQTHQLRESHSAQIEESRRKIEALTLKLRFANEKRTRNDAEAEALTRRIRELETQNGDISEQLATISAQFRDASSQLSDTSAQLSDTSEKLEREKRQREDIMRAASEATEKLNAQLRANRTELIDLQTQLRVSVLKSREKEAREGLLTEQISALRGLIDSVSADDLTPPVDALDRSVLSAAAADRTSSTPARRARPKADL